MLVVDKQFVKINFYCRKDLPSDISDLTLGQSEKDTIIFTSTDIIIDLYEYGKGPTVGKAIGETFYKLSIKLSDNTTETYYLSAGQSLWINDVKDKISFISHLKKESTPIKCYLTINSEYGVQSYNFKINPIGFSNAYLKIKPK